jgi:flagellar basal body-associated protein FliL
MDEKTPQNSPQKSKKGYGKRPLWQWIALYVVVGAIVYGIIYYLFFLPSGGSGGYTY